MSDRQKTFGNGDPRLDRALQALHDEAVTRGAPLYLDPHLGLWVQTAATLAKNGICCGKGCRHCPYDRGAQQRAGRPVLRPGDDTHQPTGQAGSGT